MNTRKFKAPFDLKSVRVSKDTISGNKDDGMYYFEVEDGGWSYGIPSEIVEAYFEEVFDEQPKITIDDIVVGKTVLIGNSGSRYLVTSSHINRLGNTVFYAGMGVTYDIDEINKLFTIEQ